MSVLYVGGPFSHFETVTEALAYLEPGDTLLIQEGTYESNEDCTD